MAVCIFPTTPQQRVTKLIYGIVALLGARESPADCVSVNWVARYAVVYKESTVFLVFYCLSNIDNNVILHFQLLLSLFQAPAFICLLK